MSQEPNQEQSTEQPESEAPDEPDEDAPTGDLVEDSALSIYWADQRLLD